MVPRLAGKVGEHCAQLGVVMGVPDPPPFVVESEKHLRDRQRQQLGIGEHRSSAPAGAWFDDTIIDEDIEFGQEGFQFFRHTLILKPSAYSSSTTRFKESTI